MTASGTYTYDLNIPVPNFACATTPNTAMVTDTGHPSNVLASDHGVDPALPDAEGPGPLQDGRTPGFTRSYDWTITKSVDQTAVTTSSDTATFNYTVVVTKSAATDSGWTVTGTISVTNPNVYSVSNVPSRSRASTTAASAS